MYRLDARLPTSDVIYLVCEILSGRNQPVRDLVSISDDRQALADLLTMEQANLLNVTRLLNRVEIRGGAGSGKTVLAMRQAEPGVRAAAARQRVGVVCYSYGLAEYLRRELLVGSRGKRPPSSAPSKTSAAAGASRSPVTGRTPGSGRWNSRPGWLRRP